MEPLSSVIAFISHQSDRVRPDIDYYMDCSRLTGCDIEQLGVLIFNAGTCSYVISNGGGAGLWSHLTDKARFLHFIGASVTVQRDGWVDHLSERIRAESGHDHTVLKNAMGGVGVLFGLANYKRPPLPREACVAFIEFSTGDLNGLTPVDHLPGILRRLMCLCVHDHTHTVVVHNWRADQPSDDSIGIRRIYDEMAAHFGIPVIRNDIFAAEKLRDHSALQALWFRDVCHTHPPGADACALNIVEALQSIDGDNPVAASDATLVDGDRVGFVGGFEILASVDSSIRGDYLYPGTGQVFPYLEIAESHKVRMVADGELMSVGFLSGPRSSWVEMRIDGTPVRKFRCFDRNSHFQRYILLPAFFTLSNSVLEFACTSDTVDVSIANKPNPDFLLPRSMSFVHLAGVSIRISDLEVLDSCHPHSPLGCLPT